MSRSKFKLNDLVVITEPIEIDPCETIIEKGERAKVIDIDPDTGDIIGRLYGYHPNLVCRNNILSLSASEASRKLKLAGSRTLTFQTGLKLVAATAVISTALMMLVDLRNDEMVIGYMASLHEATTATVTSVGCQPRDDNGGILKPPREPRMSDNSIYNTKFSPTAVINAVLAFDHQH